MTWDKTNRFETAVDWINASNDARPEKIKLDGDIVQALAKCCVKRKNIWTLRKTDPKGDAEYMVFKAFHYARHAAKWGNLAPWNEGFTFRLMKASDKDRDLFDRAFDQFGGVAK
jgi:hypothetical protein